LWFSPVAPGECIDITFKWASTTPFHILSPNANIQSHHSTLNNRSSRYNVILITYGTSVLSSSRKFRGRMGE